MTPAPISGVVLGEQERLLTEILQRHQVGTSLRCLLLADFPPKWAKALKQVLPRFYPNFSVKSTLIDHCSRYQQVYGPIVSGELTLNIINALETPATKVIKSVYSVLYELPDQYLVVMADASVATWDPPNDIGESAIIHLREEISQTLSKRTPSDTQDDLMRSLYRGDSALLAHAQKIAPTYTLDHLILKPSVKNTVTEALNIARHKIQDSFDSGWREVHHNGHNVVLVFNGPSGTGKTMAAHVIAKELGYLLYRIDYSSIHSKYIGETEKSLKAIFEAARGVPGVLLFDEGDAIFATRSNQESGSSTERYSNGEVNFLLQELERFEGIIIISTNLEKNMDEAFMRRFTRVIRFPFPTQETRALLWQKLTPPRMKFEGDVDFQTLGIFPLTGGDIRTALTEASIIGRVRGDGTVTMIDLLWAAKRVCQKKSISFRDVSNNIEIPAELLAVIGNNADQETEIYSASASPYQFKHVWDQKQRRLVDAKYESREAKTIRIAEENYTRAVNRLGREEETLRTAPGPISNEDRQWLKTLQGFLAKKPSPRNKLEIPSRYQ